MGILNSNDVKRRKSKGSRTIFNKKAQVIICASILFKAEQYHEFECDLLVLCDMHLYTNQGAYELFRQIVNKTSPARILGLHNTFNF